MPRQWRPPWNSDVIAAFGASGLFDIIESFSGHQVRLAGLIFNGHRKVIARHRNPAIEEHPPTLVLPRILVVCFGRFVITEAATITLGCLLCYANYLWRGKPRPCWSAL